MIKSISNMKSPFTNERVFLVEDVERQEFRKEIYEVHVRYYEGEQTKEQFTTTEQDEASFNELYNQYRVKHGIPFPDEIKQIREKYGLSYTQITKIVGFGQNQWRLYENGQVPTESNGKSIVAASDKDAMMRMLEASKQEFPDEEYKKIASGIITSDYITNVENDSLRFYFYGNTKRGIYNGFAPLCPNKIKAMVCLFVHNETGGVGKTKLNKEMFFADFLHYRRHGKSISGLAYQAIQLGPVPYHYDTIYDHIDTLERKTIYAQDFDFTLFESQKPDTLSLSDDEMKTIHDVSKELAPMTKSEVVKLAHKEKAWLRYKDSHSLVPYSEAFGLEAFK